MISVATLNAVPVKRRSTAALQNVAAVTSADFSLASCSAAVLRRFSFAESFPHTGGQIPRT